MAIHDGPFSLTIRAKHLIDAVRSRYRGVPLRELGGAAGLPPSPGRGGSTVK